MTLKRSRSESFKKKWDFLTFFVIFNFFSANFLLLPRLFHLLFSNVTFCEFSWLFFFRLFFKGVRYFFEWFTPRMLWERGGEQIFVINAWSILYCVIDIIQFVEINVRQWAHSKLLEAIVTVENYTNIVLYKKNHIGKGRILDSMSNTT